MANITRLTNPTDATNWIWENESSTSSDGTASSSVSSSPSHDSSQLDDMDYDDSTAAAIAQQPSRAAIPSILNIPSSVDVEMDDSDSAAAAAVQPPSHAATPPQENLRKRSFDVFTRTTSYDDSSMYLPLKVQKTQETDETPKAYLDPADLDVGVGYAIDGNSYGLRTLLKPNGDHRVLLSEITQIAQEAIKNGKHNILFLIKKVHLPQATIHKEIPAFNSSFQNGLSPLAQAALKKDKTLVLFLLENGANAKDTIAELKQMWDAHNKQDEDDPNNTQSTIFSAIVFLNQILRR